MSAILRHFARLPAGLEATHFMINNFIVCLECAHCRDLAGQSEFLPVGGNLVVDATVPIASTCTIHQVPPTAVGAVPDGALKGVGFPGKRNAKFQSSALLSTQYVSPNMDASSDKNVETRLASSASAKKDHSLGQAPVSDYLF
jgi:hypothetical protein